MSRATYLIDTSLCIGCETCGIACKDRADLPDDIDRLWVDRDEAGSYPSPTLRYRVVHCFHCAAPTCAAVCPVGALVKGADGLVTLNRAVCIGCGACIDACPFGAVAMLPEGVADKCDGCADELARGWEPTCVRACPMRALDYTPFDGTPPAGRIADDSFDHHGIGPAVVYWRRDGQSA
ncbi:MAG TPA: 4Fe-4S dicluster domain-containing protein [Chloroflexi bacterium]|jgi:Fe-S-cluster-containing dehydrogenase component|nr:4Fe-4S dicluster domain-containing protein [Chloroflexota bacterium]